MLQRRLHARAMLGDTPPHYDEPQEASHLGAEVQNAYRNGVSLLESVCFRATSS